MAETHARALRNQRYAADLQTSYCASTGIRMINTLISGITDRMPAILPREAWPIWLGETAARRPLLRDDAVVPDKGPSCSYERFSYVAI